MPLCEAVDRSGAVFVDTANEIVGDTGIKCPVLSRGEHVDKVLQGSIIARPWIPDQVRDDGLLLAARMRGEQRHSTYLTGVRTLIGTVSPYSRIPSFPEAVER